MVQLNVYNEDGSKADAVDLPEGAFGSVIKRALLKQYVDMYRANQRHGCAATKDRSMMRGSGRKLYRQKGTGNARAGSRKSPVRRGGGTVFGPSPRDFSHDMPKTAKREALRSALLSKFQDGQVLVVEALKFDKPSTAKIATLLTALGARKSCLIILPEVDPMVYKSVRNLQKINVLPVSDLNAYDVLLGRNLLITKDALKKLEGAFA